MTPLQVGKLEFYRQKIGSMTSAEAMQLALEAERIAKECGPHDIAFECFTKEKEVMVNYAELLELEENQHKQKDNPS